MKILVYPADLTGCGYFRLIWPAVELRKQGHDVTIIPPKKRGGSFTASMGGPKGETVLDVSLPFTPDVLVVQRVTHNHLAQAVGVLRSKGIATVVDVDDDLSCIHHEHPAHSVLQPKKDTRLMNDALKYNNWQNTALACQNASLVQVSSDALLHRYAKHGRGVVIRNYVPEGYLGIRHVDSNLVGWGGAVISHPGDLKVVGSAVQRIVRDGIPFKVIGPSDKLKEELKLSETPAHSGFVDIKKWPIALSELGVGMAPLDVSTKFNESKSWLKPLEMAALGIPCVMSPSREYIQLHEEHGIGVLAKNERQWYRELKRLAEDHSYRQELGTKSRQIAHDLTIEKNAWRWAAAWTQAVENL